MTTLQQDATNVIEDARVYIDIGDTHTIEADYVEYCIDSGYVKAVDGDETSHITHISNVEICADGGNGPRF